MSPISVDATNVEVWVDATDFWYVIYPASFTMHIQTCTLSFYDLMCDMTRKRSKESIGPAQHSNSDNSSIRAASARETRALVSIIHMFRYPKKEATTVYRADD